MFFWLNLWARSPLFLYNYITYCENNGPRLIKLVVYEPYAKYFIILNGSKNG